MTERSAVRGPTVTGAGVDLPPRRDASGRAPAGCRHGADDMELTKPGPACVVLSAGDRRVVVEPGVFIDAEALDGAPAVLITHDHAAHLAAGRLRAAMDADPALAVWANKSVVAQLEGL